MASFFKLVIFPLLILLKDKVNTEGHGRKITKCNVIGKNFLLKEEKEELPTFLLHEGMCFRTIYLYKEVKTHAKQ